MNGRVSCTGTIDSFPRSLARNLVDITSRGFMAPPCVVCIVNTSSLTLLYAGLVDLVLDQPAPSLDDDPTPARPAHKALDINLVGVYMSTYLALHYFRLPPKSGQESFKKSLVLISSITGYLDLP